VGKFIGIETWREDLTLSTPDTGCLLRLVWWMLGWVAGLHIASMRFCTDVSVHVPIGVRCTRFNEALGVGSKLDFCENAASGCSRCIGWHSII